MSEPQLSIRSARARDLAHRLAKRENRTVAQIVERALESYADREAGRETPRAFYQRLAADSSVDLDLSEIIRAQHRPHSGIDL